MLNTRDKDKCFDDWITGLVIFVLRFPSLMKWDGFIWTGNETGQWCINVTSFWDGDDDDDPNNNNNNYYNYNKGNNNKYKPNQTNIKIKILKRFFTTIENLQGQSTLRSWILKLKSSRNRCLLVSLVSYLLQEQSNALIHFIY